MSQENVCRFCFEEFASKWGLTGHECKVMKEIKDAEEAE